ncbi:MAG: hypothetical protein WCV84_05475 [Patescibacteria group bacterium]
MASDLKQLHKHCEDKELKDLLGKALRLEKRYTRPNPLNLVRMIRDKHCWCRKHGSAGFTGLCALGTFALTIALALSANGAWVISALCLIGFLTGMLLDLMEEATVPCPHKAEKERRLAFVREHPLQAAMEEGVNACFEHLMHELNQLEIGIGVRGECGLLKVQEACREHPEDSLLARKAVLQEEIEACRLCIFGVFEQYRKHLAFEEAARLRNNEFEDKMRELRTRAFGDPR